jgi:hypothetical protein
MNNQCSSLTINTPPYLEISVGQGLFKSNTFDNITKVDINKITKDEIIYGASFGKVLNRKSDYSVSANLGYNIAGCIMVCATFGYTNTTTARFNRKSDLIVYQGWHKNIGMSAKFISGRVTFGAFGSSSGIGFSIGTIIN